MAAFYYLIGVGAVASALFLIGVGYLYSATGTLNISHMIAKLRDLNQSNAIYLGLCLMAIGLLIKSAIIPMHTWILKVYEHTNTVILPFLGGTSNKIYFYVFIKLFILGFFNFGIIKYFLLVAGIIMIMWFSIAALFNKTLRGVLALSSLAQIGLVSIALVMAEENTLAITSLMLISHGIASAPVFMLLTRISCPVTDFNRKASFHAGLFIINALSFVGFPATAGFLPKVWFLNSLVNQHKFGLFFLMAFAFFLTFAYLFRIVRIFLFGEQKAAQPIPKRYIFIEDTIIVALTVANVGFGLFSLNFLKMLI